MFSVLYVSVKCFSSRIVCLERIKKKNIHCARTAVRSLTTEKKNKMNNKTI